MRTTAFCSYLQQHPSIVFPAGKEPNTLYDWRVVPKWLYGNERNLKGLPNHAYNAKFEDSRKLPYRGDASQTYGIAADFGHQLAKLRPGAKVFLLIRDQKERLISTFLYFYLLHRQDNIRDWIQDFLVPDISSYLYFDKIVAYHEEFGKDLLVIKSDYLKNNTQETMDHVFQFLGLQSIKIRPTFENVNVFTPNDSRLYRTMILLSRVLFKGIKLIFEPLGLHDELNSMTQSFLRAASSRSKNQAISAKDGRSMVDSLPTDIVSIITQDYHRSIEFCQENGILLPSVSRNYHR